MRKVFEEYTFHVSTVQFFDIVSKILKEAEVQVLQCCREKAQLNYARVQLRVH
jgi:hypothetical protein